MIKLKRGLAIAGVICFCLLQRGLGDTALVFNEIMYHPQTNEPAFEWVEFYNQMAVDLDVSGWTITNGITYRFPEGTIVHGGAYIVVAISPSDLISATGATNVLGPFSGRISNSGETLELRNNDGRIEDSISYGTDGDWPVGPDGAGVSLAKLDPSTASAPAENWARSAQVGGTPGAANFPAPTVLPDQALVFNEVAAATNATFWLELFNDGTNDLSLDNYAIALQGSTNGTYLFASGSRLTAGALTTLDQTQLGFKPQSGDRLFLYDPARDRVLDAVVVKDKLRGRSPDGSGQWRHPNQPTPGASNSFAFHTEIVINEIMYDHYPTQTPAGPQPSSEQWVEFYNRGTNAVDLTGWTIDGGIQYSFPAGRTMAAGSYLVVAKQTAVMQALYPGITIVGDFSKSLSHHNDEIVLKDANGDPVNKVHYYDKGHWPGFANRGGSSLELRDPWADNSKPEAWAASDETHKSAWSNYTYSAVAAADGGPIRWNEFVLGMLTDGECLVDDISVLELSTGPPVQKVANGDFENGITGWRVLGNHNRTRVEADPDNAGNHVLHVVATGPTETMHNHVETTYIGNVPITNGLTYQVSFRAKWLGGVTLLNTRLYFNRIHQTAVLPIPALNGTPGAQNSRYETNIGPTFSHLQNQPAVPAADQPVTISVVAKDPQGVSSCSVWWSANGGAWSNAPMTLQSGNVYAGVVPGLPAATTVQFYIEAFDSPGARSMYPALGPDSRALYKVNDGLAALNQGHNIRIIMTPDDVNLLNAPTNVMSNDNLGATIVYDEQRPYYDMGIRLKSSERGRVYPSRVGYHLEFNSEDVFRGVHPVMLIDRSGQRGNFDQKEIVVKHMMNHAGGIPQVYNDLSRAIGPQDGQASSSIFFPRFEDEFLKAAYPTDGTGNLYEYEYYYFPLTTLDGTPTGYKLPQPDNIIGADLSDLGNDKENYRYRFITKNNREVDDYSRLMEFCKIFNLAGSTLDAQSQRLMEVDEWLRSFAMQALCGVDENYSAWVDDYYHNVLLYVRSDTQKVVAFPWDMDWCFLEPQHGPLVGDVNLAKIINLPANLRAYYAHALDLIDSTFNPGYMAYWTQHYTNFCPGQDFSDTLAYIDDRSNFVRTNLASLATNAFELKGTNFFSASSDLITVTGTAPVQVRSILVNGLAYPVTWVNVTDWTLTLALNPGTNNFQLQGYDMRGNVLSNAAVSFAANYTGSSVDPVGTIVINEIMYNPVTPNASFVELYNTSSNAAFDLTGWRLDGVGFTFPPMVITNGQFLVLAKDLDAFTAVYGNGIQPAALFGGLLEPAGEALSLSKPGPTANLDTVIDRVRYEPGAPWPAAANGTGGSLQLIDPSQDNSRVSNWGAAPGVATPGAVNSFTAALPAYPPLWLNEAQPDNLSGIADNHGQRDPWVELYNAGAVPVSLDGLSLANNYTNLSQWAFPTGSAINPGEFKIIFADGQPEQSTSTELHTSFRLSSGAGSIVLSRTNGGGPQILDYINYSQVHSNLSFGSFPDGQPFYRQEFYFVTPGAANNGTSPPQGIFINEWMASNTGFIRDPADNATDDWFELYNPNSSPFNLEGYYLTGNLTNKTKFRIPAGYVIPAFGYFLVWADNTPSQNSPSRPDLHVTFALSKNGDSIGLFAPDLTQIDALTFGLQTNNISQGRYPDGAASIYYMTTPTPKSANVPPFANRPPVLGPVGNQVVYVGQTLRFTVSATDTDLPPQTLTFTLDAGAPPGASIDTHTGAFAWTPSAEQAPSTNVLSVTVTDNGTPNLSATRAFQVIVYKMNTAPVLPDLTDQTLNELSMLIVTNTATDTDYPPNALIYSLLNPPSGANIDTNGIIQWTPSEAQGPGVYSITTVVTDNGQPAALSATNTFNVAVQEVNSAPVLPVLPDLTMNELTLLTVTNTATDADLPANALTYSLLNPPAGASIDTNGVLRWTPSEAQGPGAFTLTTVVTDDGAPNLKATNRFNVLVQEINLPPILDHIGDRAVTNGGTVTFRATATDPDIPANTLRFSLDTGAPAGATIHAGNGLFSWTPSSGEGPGAYQITVRVTDNGTPPLSSSESILVTVFSTNLPLVLMRLTNVWKYDQSGANLGTAWRQTNYNDSAWPSGPALLYHEEATLPAPKNTPLNLTNSAGKVIITYYFRTHFNLPSDATGVVLTSSNLIDDGVVYYLNGAEAARYNMPTGAINNATFAATVITDATNYIVTNLVTGSLLPGDNLLAAEVHQGSSNSTDIVFGMALKALVPPQGGIGITSQPADVAVQVGQAAQFTVSASGSSARYQWFKDGVAINGANDDTYSLVSVQFADAGAYSVVVSNLVSTATSRKASLTVNPLPNTAPVLAAVSDWTVNEQALLTFSASATDTDAPPQTLAFSLDPGAPAGASVTTNGLFTWTPSEAQGPGSFPITIRVTDNGSPVLSASSTFNVVVKEINVAPILPTLPDRSILPLTHLIVTNTATDLDIPANVLAYALAAPPAGASVDANGVITWFPLEAQAPGYYTITTIVTDDNPDAENARHLSATNSFTVTVIETRPLLPLVVSGGGGSVALAPSGGRYPLNTVVQLTAQPSPGWSFLEWTGDLAGANPVASLVMDRPKSVRAIFGATLDTRVNGGGEIVLFPTNRIVPFGATVNVTAVPGSNSFFSVWNITNASGSGSTTANPITYAVADPTVTFEAVFEPLDAGQVTVTAVLHGRGQVNVTPQANHYTAGTTVHLQAVPDAGQKFLGWTGDATAATSNLDVLLDRSKVLTANFSMRPRLDLIDAMHRQPTDPILINLTGEPGTSYEILGSTDLQNWDSVAVVTNSFGTAQITDLMAPNLPRRSYEAVSPPGYRPPPPMTIVPAGSVWKYLDNGSDQGIAWSANNFDDGSWAAGPAQLGYGDGDEATIVSFGPDDGNKYITTYFRHSFTVSNASNVVGLKLRLLRDDGAVVYLNGMEALRSNMPNGPVSYTTLASLGVGGLAESTFYEFIVDPALLVEGVNVLAVEIHQVSHLSSDISFDLELTGQRE